ncbi:MAG: hypothetical protein IT368_15455 [Candidatus Hydrogenedentes bacterium]|nr:hypothetical protein [Candidatus Hydrogenedentota bacterium]
MATSKLDSQLRITLPEGQPGDEYEIQKQDKGRLLLIPVQKIESSEPSTREEILKAIEENPIRMEMTWEELRAMTREP